MQPPYPITLKTLCHIYITPHHCYYIQTTNINRASVVLNEVFANPPAEMLSSLCDNPLNSRFSTALLLLSSCMTTRRHENRVVSLNIMRRNALNKKLLRYDTHNTTCTHSPRISITKPSAPLEEALIRRRRHRQCWSEDWRICRRLIRRV